MATPATFKNLAAQPVLAVDPTGYVYFINAAGTIEGRGLISDFLAQGIQPSWVRNNSGGLLEVGKKYINVGTADRDLPAITVDGQVITMVRNDESNEFDIQPNGADTVGDDTFLTVDLNATQFDLVANLADKNWEVY